MLEVSANNQPADAVSGIAGTSCPVPGAASPFESTRREEAGAACSYATLHYAPRGTTRGDPAVRISQPPSGHADAFPVDSDRAACLRGRGALGSRSLSGGAGSSQRRRHHECRYQDRCQTHAAEAVSPLDESLSLQVQLRPLGRWAIRALTDHARLGRPYMFPLRLLIGHSSAALHGPGARQWRDSLANIPTRCHSHVPDP